MERKFTDMTGQKFGRLLVIERSGRSTRGFVAWLCQCDCGGTKIADGGSLREGFVKSCGCLLIETAAERNFKHGRCGTPEHRAWKALRGRCNNPNDPAYANYGGRGIRVCERWNSFDNFLADMGLKPTPKHSIDRIDNNGNYEPGNCRWATDSQQNKNKRYPSRKK